MYSIYNSCNFENLAEKYFILIENEIKIDNPFCRLEFKLMDNLLYKIFDENQMVFKRNLQNKIPKDTQFEFLKNYEIFNIQDRMLKKFLSVKYKFWRKNMKGKNIKVALFDSGVNNKNINCNLIENINLTNEENEDFTGHGTFLASVNNIKKLFYIFF